MAIKKNMGIFTQCYLMTIIFCTVLLCGCGQDSIPEPPLEKNRLLIDAMRNIRKQKHGLALARLKKLKIIYPDNQHLAAVIGIEYDNIFVQKIQSGVDQGNLKAALLIIKRAEKIKPLSPSLLKIKQELLHLNALNNALLAIENPSSSTVLNDAIKQARQVIKEFPVAQSYLPLLDKYDQLAAQMAVDEAKNARLDLVSDLKIEKNRSKTDRKLVEILAAQVEVEHAESQ
ncbi:MAG: hypothetical protein L3J71_09730 [Victivallaceae bacterium]|nr:hypothetical protein [Victivallaceae bacterium]